MKHLFLLISITLSLFHSSFGQTFNGSHDKHSNIYDWTLMIQKDSSVNLVCELNEKAIYEEFVGKITRINDSLYNITARLLTAQHIMKAHYPDSIFIQMDTSIAKEIDKISIEYSNGKKVDISKYSQKWFKYYGISTFSDTTLFNEQQGKNFIFIIINRKNNITDEFLKFRIPFGSSPYLWTGDMINFQVIIKNNFVQTYGPLPFEYGHFKLKRNQRIK